MNDRLLPAVARPRSPGRRGPSRASILLVALCLAAGAWAQTPFALQGLGQNVAQDSARDLGRGGWGLADSDTLAPGTRNPAALANLRFLGLVISGYGEASATAGGGLARDTRRAFLPNVRLGVPLLAGRLALHAGFSVQRSMKYETQAEFELEHLDQTVRGIERYFRDGTLYAIPIGLSWRAAEPLAIGASVNMVRGVVNDALSQVFTEPAGSYYLPSIREQQDELSGTNLTLAALWDGNRRVQLGASVSTGYDLAMARTVTLAGVGEQATQRLTGAMPPEYRAGLQVALAGDWRFGLDGQLARYSEFRGRPDWQDALRDEWTVAAGFERRLAFRQHGRGYDVPWRFGYQHRVWAHEVGGAPVREHGVGVGTGFPFRNRLGTIDLSLSYHWIGAEGENGWRTRALRLGLSITGLEGLVF